jgi:transposase InsO family protein
MRTPTDCCASTFQKAPISACTAPRRSRPWRSPSTAGHERRMIGKRLQKRLTSCFYRPTNVVLRRPLESAQYLSIKYTERLAEAGIEPSVGSVGDSYDNTLAETIDGLYKAEVIHRRGPWRTMEALKFATLEWVDWFNNRRLLEPIGTSRRLKPEERYYAKLENPAMCLTIGAMPRMVHVWPPVRIARKRSRPHR